MSRQRWSRHQIQKGVVAYTLGRGTGGCWAALERLSGRRRGWSASIYLPGAGQYTATWAAQLEGCSLADAKRTCERRIEEIEAQIVGAATAAGRTTAAPINQLRDEVIELDAAGGQA